MECNKKGHKVIIMSFLIAGCTCDLHFSSFCSSAYIGPKIQQFSCVLHVQWVTVAVVSTSVVLIKATSEFARCLKGKSYIGVCALLSVYIDGVVQGDPREPNIFKINCTQLFFK